MMGDRERRVIGKRTRGRAMDDDETTPVRRTVRLAVILLLVGGLYLAGFNVLLSVVVGMIPLWYSSGWGESAGVDDDNGEPQRLAQRLHRAQRVAWHELADRAHLIDFLRSRTGRGGRASLLPPRVGQWPPVKVDPSPVPFASPGPVTAEQVADAVAMTTEQWRTLVVTGGEDTGKTTLMLLMLLQAEHVRDAVDQDAPLPLRISLAGWPNDPDLTLREWLSRRVRQDYPRLLGPGRSLEEVVGWGLGGDEVGAHPGPLLLGRLLPRPHR